MGRSHDSRVPDRVASYAGVVGALIGAAYLAGGFVAGHTSELLSRVGVALAFLFGGVGLGWVGRRVGTVMSRVNDLSAQMSTSASDQAAQTREILDRLGGISLALQQHTAASPQPKRARGATIASETHHAAAEPEDSLQLTTVDVMSDAMLDPLPPVSTVASAAPPHSHAPDISAPSPAAAAWSAATAGVDPALLARIMSELEDLREITLMNDEQRQLRLSQHLEARRRLALDKVFLCFRTGQWAVADEILTQLEVQYPNESPVKQARSEFFRLRTLAEPDALCHTEQRVRDLVHANAWDRAIALATEFVNDFPSNEDGRHLLAEVNREYNAMRDADYQRGYEQVQSNIHRRLWRAALADAERLLEEFADHPRSGRLRGQLRTLRENAEIEERQEHEMRLQILLEQRRFADAVREAEELVRRFPGSPQAEALIERLPQLRQLAAEDAEADLV
jgi:hypothetical protein